MCLDLDKKIPKNRYFFFGNCHLNLYSVKYEGGANSVCKRRVKEIVEEK